MTSKSSPFVLANDSKTKKLVTSDRVLVAPEASPMFDNSFLKAYKIAAFLKVYNYGVRPTRLKREVLYAQIENLYDERFKHEREYVRKTLNKYTDQSDLRAPGPFPIWVYSHFKQRIGANLSLVETRLVNLLFSLETYYNSWEQFNLFYMFVNEVYDASDLNCFLLLRSIVLDEMRAQNKKLTAKKQVQLFNFPLTVSACRKYVEEVFTDSSAVNPAMIVAELEEALKKNSLGDRLSAYDFLSFVVREYRNVRDNKKTPVDLQANTLTLGADNGFGGTMIVDLDLGLEAETHKPHETVALRQSDLDPETNAKLINPLITSEMRLLVNQFVDGVSEDDDDQMSNATAITQAKELITAKLDRLLRAFFESNKVLWFKELMIEPQNEESLLHVEGLFKRYREFTKSEVRPNVEYRDFCKRILKTPELTDQISELLTCLLAEDGQDDSKNALSGEEPSKGMNRSHREEDTWGRAFSGHNFSQSRSLNDRNVFKDEGSDDGF